MFPTGQKPEKWTRGFRVEQFHTNLGATSARQIYDMKIQASESACQSHEATPIREQPENGYSMTLWSEACEIDADKKTVTLIKVIVGNERLYVVSKIWKNTPKDWDVELWQRNLNDIFVCDPTSGQHPCNWLRSRDRGARRP